MMDLPLMELNHGKESGILLDMYEQILDITVDSDTRYRYNKMMESRANLAKRQKTPYAKKRRRELKVEAKRVTAERTRQWAAADKIAYKDKSDDEFVRFYLGGATHTYFSI